MGGDGPCPYFGASSGHPRGGPVAAGGHLLLLLPSHLGPGGHAAAEPAPATYSTNSSTIISNTMPAGSPRPQPATNAILVGKRQQGSPLQQYIRNVRWQYADVGVDYVPGASTCALFISLR